MVGFSFQWDVSPWKSVHVALTLITSPWVKFRSMGVTDIQLFSNEEIIDPLLLIVHSICGSSRGLSEHVAENEEGFSREIVEEIGGKLVGESIGGMLLSIVILMS